MHPLHTDRRSDGRQPCL